jgi:hypothetical protein
MTEINDWTEWKEKCAVDLCCDEARSRLKGFVYAVSRNRLKILSPTFQSPSFEEAFHLLEVDCHISTTSKGKRYKDWIFDHADKSNQPRLEAIKTAVSMRLRDVCERLARYEGHSRDHKRGITPVSLDSPIAPGSNLTIGDFAPDEQCFNSDVEIREYEEIAVGIAARVFSTLDDLTQATIAASALEIPLTDSELNALLDKGKNALYRRLNSALEAINAQIEKEYPEEEEASIKLLVDMARHEIGELSLEKAKKDRESKLGQLFTWYERRIRDESGGQS